MTKNERRDFFEKYKCNFNVCLYCFKKCVGTIAILSPNNKNQCKNLCKKCFVGGWR